MMRTKPTILSLALALPVAAQTVPADDLGKVMSAFDAVDELAAKKPDLWPGFDLAAVPIAVWQPAGSMLLVGHPAPPVGRQYKTSGRVAVLAPAAPECWGVPWAMVAGHATACVEMRELCDNPKPARRLAESAFAAFLGARAPSPTLQERLAWDEDDGDNMGALEVEQRLLDEAHEQDPAGIPDRAREWLGLREARRTRLKAGARAYEAKVERAGLGAYVAARGMFGVPADADGDEGRIARVVAGVGRLLDTLRPAWRDEALGKQSLEDLVRASVKGEVRKAAEAARQRLAASLLIDAAGRRALRAGRDRAAFWSQVEAAGGIGVLAIDLGAPIADAARAVDPRGLRRIDAGRRVFAMPTRLDFGARGTLRSALPVAETAPAGRFAVRMPPGVRIEADGRALTPQTPVKLGYQQLVVAGDGLAVELKGGGTIEVRDRGVLVRPSRSAP